MSELTDRQINILNIYHLHIGATHLLSGNRMKSANALSVSVEEFDKLYEQYKKERNL